MHWQVDQPFSFKFTWNLKSLICEKMFDLKKWICETCFLTNKSFESFYTFLFFVFFIRKFFIRNSKTQNLKKMLGKSPVWNTCAAVFENANFSWTLQNWVSFSIFSFIINGSTPLFSTHVNVELKKNKIKVKKTITKVSA